MFACEIASRAHYNLKQSKYVSYFVSNLAGLRNFSKTIFLQRYLTDFADLSRRQIDISLAMAGEDLNAVMFPLVSHVTINLKCKKLDENFLYLLQNFNVQKYCQNFPGEYSSTASFLAEIADVSESSEVKEVVKEFVEHGSDDISSSSEDDGADTTDDSDESNCENGVEVAIQTDRVEIYGKYIDKSHNRASRPSLPLDAFMVHNGLISFLLTY